MNRNTVKWSFSVLLFVILLPFGFWKFHKISLEKIGIKDPVICKNCNIVLVSLDTLGAQHLPCYGYALNTAPNLCKFAKDNILFSNAYSQSYWTFPSQTSLFTSLYPSTHQQLNPLNSPELSSKYTTLTQILHNNGYQTVYAGPDPDQFNSPFRPSFVNQFDMDLHRLYNSRSLSHWQYALETLKNNQNKNTPTFLYLHTYAVHDPYVIDKKEKYKFIKEADKHKEMPIFSEDFDFTNSPDFFNFVIQTLEERLNKSETQEGKDKINKMLLPLKKAKTLEEKRIIFDTFNDGEIRGDDHDWYAKNFDGKSQDKTDYIKSLYDERTYDLDQGISNFLTFFKENPEIGKKTIVIFFGDHGEAFWEHGSFFHCSSTDNGCLYDEIIKVPLIMSVPGIKNSQIKSVVQLIDVYPTLLKLVGIDKPDHLSGVDLSDKIFGNFFPKKDTNYAISEQYIDDKVVIDQNLNKLYLHGNLNDKIRKVELFDLKKDPGEKNNIADKNPQLTESLSKVLYSFNEVYSKNINQPDFPNWIDGLKKDKLIKTGYF